MTRTRLTSPSGLGLTGDQLVRKCATLVGVHNYGEEDLREAVAFLARCPHQQQLRWVAGARRRRRVRVPPAGPWSARPSPSHSSRLPWPWPREAPSRGFYSTALNKTVRCMGVYSSCS